MVEAIAGAPVQEKVLTELGVAWPDLAGPQARMAETLRVFLVTWDPLEHQLAAAPDVAARVDPYAEHHDAGDQIRLR